MNEMTKVSHDAKTKLWIERIQACRSSGITARQWCKDNNISEQTYYKWVKKLKTMGIDSDLVEKQTFVSVPMESVRSSNAEMIVISKGDIHIEVPETIEESILVGMVKLLC